MNKFRANLHPAFFDPKGSPEFGHYDWRTYGKHNWNPEDDSFNAPDLKEVVVTWEKLKRRKAKEERELREATLEDAGKLKTDILQPNLRRNNESLASNISTIETKEEKEQTDEEVAKQLEKQLKQLAKNKKIDLPWTDNAWKCSRAEKRLATSSAKVFVQLLGVWKVEDMINKCKSTNWDLTEQDAEAWKAGLGINSKVKDIQRFCKSFQEYQNPQSEYQHLKNLIGFFCENKFENIKDVKVALETRSEKISKQDINNAWKMLYQEWWVRDADWRENYVVVDNRTGERLERKPKDWKQRASFEIIKDRLKKENSITNKMLTLLWDFNLDGEVNSGDVGYKTWTQFVEVFRRSVATKHLENADFNDDAAVKNLVAYVNKFGMDIQNVQTVDGLYQWMTDNKNWYENTKKLQNFLRNLPVEFDDVISNWAEAWKRSLDRMVSAINLEEQEKESVRNEAEAKAKEIISAGEAQLKEVIKDDRERADVAQQLLDQLPLMLISKATEQQTGLAAGAAVPLDQIIKWMSGGFNVWVGPDGKPVFWLFLWWDRKFNLSDRTQLETAVTAGNKLLFIPCAAASMEISRDMNEGRRNKSLDATGEHRISLWWNVAITAGIFSYGFSVGVDNNKQVGIEKQAQNINKVVKEQAKERVKALSGASDKKAALINALKDEKKGFPKASEWELNAAADNLLSIIQQFKIDEQSTEADFDVYAQVIADVYAEQWRNAALTWIADKKRKISWWKVGIQFIAWCIPVVSLVARFTKYRNARTNETEHSRVARIDAQFNGVGNSKNILEDLKAKEIKKEQVDQINEILERYWSKVKLDYKEGVDWKPWRIQVPAVISDGIWINIRVSESMKWYVKKEADWIYSFPANAIYRLLQETGGNQRSLTLNIGSDKTNPSDVLISDSEKMEWLKGDKELMWAKRLEYKDPVTTSFEYKPNIDTLFTPDVVEWLRTIDSSNRRRFSKFMKTKKDAVADFNDMVNAMVDVLWKNKKYEAIKQRLLDAETSNEDKQLIIDRVMAISAEANVHNSRWLNENVRLRRDYYRRETMKGPNWQSIFDKLSVNRDEFIKTLNGNYAMESKQNLLWATAFYNRNNSAKWLAITWLGATNVLWWKTQELTGEDRKKVETWFLGWNNENDEYVPWTLQKSPMEWDNLKRALESKISNKLSDADVWDLLKKWEIVLDNSQKKVKVKLDVKYVFYLMWECANESVGIEMWNIQIQEEHEVDDYSQWSLYLNNGDWTSSVNVSRRDFAAGAAVGWQEKNNDEWESSTLPTQRELWPVDKTNPEWTTEITDDNAGNWNGGGWTHRHR